MHSRFLKECQTFFNVQIQPFFKLGNSRPFLSIFFKFSTSVTVLNRREYSCLYCLKRAKLGYISSYTSEQMCKVMEGHVK